MDKSQEELNEKYKKTLEGQRWLNMMYEIQIASEQHKKFEIDFELAKLTLNDYNKVKKQERFRFWIPVGISVLALVVAVSSVVLQQKSLYIAPMPKQQSTKEQKPLRLHYPKTDTPNKR